MIPRTMTDRTDTLRKRFQYGILSLESQRPKNSYEIFKTKQSVCYFWSVSLSIFNLVFSVVYTTDGRLLVILMFFFPKRLNES